LILIISCYIVSFMKELKIVTHSGRFHADESFGVAALRIFFENKGIRPRIYRTRDEKVIREGDIVLDVGGVYNQAENRFDHHQEGGAGRRQNNIPYAAFGLVWKRYGEELAGSKEAANLIDEKLVEQIDSYDNGEVLFTPISKDIQPYLMNDVVSAYLPTWKEKDDSEAFDEAFNKAVAVARELLEREIKRAKDKLEASHFVREAYEKTKDKRVLVLDQSYPWREVADTLPELLFVIHPEDSKWHVLAVRKSVSGFENRKSFPASWAGKRDVELAAVSGVPDAVFCHNKLFIAVAKSKEGAIVLARRAIGS